MNRKSYRMLAFVLALAVVFGMFAAMVPATAEAAGPNNHPPTHMKSHGGKAYFKPNELPNPFVRDFDGDCEWWKYELRGGRYVRVYCLCRYGDAEISYRNNVRSQWAAYDFSQGVSPVTD